LSASFRPILSDKEKDTLSHGAREKTGAESGIVFQKQENSCGQNPQEFFTACL